LLIGGASPNVASNCESTTIEGGEAATGLSYESTTTTLTREGDNSSISVPVSDDLSIVNN